VGSREANSRRFATIAAIAAGALFGWTYLVRELSPILIPSVVAAALLLRLPVRRALLVATSCLLTVSLEFLYGAVRYGDPLARAHVLLDRGDRPLRLSRQMWLERLNEQLDDPLAAILVLPRLLLAWDTGWPLVALICVLLVGLLWIRDRRLWVFGAWFLTVVTTLALLVLLPLSTGEPLVKGSNVRYWYPAFPPLVMGAFGTLALLARRYAPCGRAVAVGASVATLVALGVIVPGTLEFRSCAAKDVWQNDPGTAWDDLRKWLATAEAQRFSALRTDAPSSRLVPAFQRTMLGSVLWPGQAIGFPTQKFLDPSDRSMLILVHKDRFVRDLPDAEERLRRLSRTWRPAFVSRDGDILVLRPSIPARDASEAGSDWTSLTSLPDGASAGSGECGVAPYGS
jgi:hypothetical protein